MTTEKDPFLKMAEGRVPISTAFGAASTVVGEGAVPRPDRSYTILKWLSIFGGILGLDHFYLRSPYSGLLKGLTGGGFLIWWLWDAFQLSTEKDRVLLYGMSAPFDMKMGFGQGTIAEGKTHYEQRSDSALWILAALFSFVGADALLFGNWGQLLRKLTEGVVFAVLIWSLTTTWNENGLDGLATFGNVFKLLLSVMFGFIIVIQWANVALPTLTDPVSVFTKGLRVSQKQDNILNFPRAWVDNITLFGTDIKDQVMKDIGYETITGEEMRKKFEVRYVSAADREAEAKQEDAEAKAAKAAKADGIHWHWVLSYLVYLFGPLLLIPQGIMWVVKKIWRATPWGAAQEGIQAGLQAGIEMTKGVSPMAAFEKAAESQIPGLSMMTEKVAAAKKAAEKVANPFAAAAKLAGAAQVGGAQVGGGQPSSQGMILGASVFALAGGAAIKLAVDYLLPQ